jgi:uncharacterized small protein (DUF1192 family)
MPMDWDEPRTVKKRLEPANLEVMGVAELTEYVGELQAEIARVRTTIAAKEKTRAGAEALFRK